MNTIEQVLRANLEPSEPQGRILEFWKANEGKRLDKRFIDKLKVAVNLPEIRYYYIAGMTSIVWGNRADMTIKDKGGQLFIGYDSEGKLVANSAQFEERNLAYFGAAVQRNEARYDAIKDIRGQQELEAAAKQFKAAKETLTRLFAYGSHFNHDETEIRKALGIYEERR